jgi:isopenicillin-N epimerase
MALKVQAELAEIGGLPPICANGDEWVGQMVACPLPVDDPHAFKTRLYDEYRVEVPMGKFGDHATVRVSCQGYTTENDLDRLFEGVKALL